MMEQNRKQKEFAAKIEKYRYQKKEYDQIRFGAKQEQDMYEMVATGNIGRLDTGEAEAPDLYLDMIGDFALGDRKKIEYMVVITITLARRAAVEGGMDYLLSCDLSDVYLKELENCKDTNEMMDILNLAVRDYTIRVKEIRDRESRNQYVEYCKTWISRSITKPFDREKLASELGLEANYMSTMFKKETGMTLSQYRLDARLHASANMLQYSDCKIADIAERFEFGSASNYGRYFKKKYGMTPKEYRIKNRKFDYLEGV